MIFTFILSNYKIHFVGNHFLKSLKQKNRPLVRHPLPALLQYTVTQWMSTQNYMYIHICISMYVQSDRKNLKYQKSVDIPYSIEFLKHE